MTTSQLPTELGKRQYPIDFETPRTQKIESTTSPFSIKFVSTLKLSTMSYWYAACICALPSISK